VFRKGLLRSVIHCLIIGLVLFWTLAVISLFCLRWVAPPTSAIRIERSFQALIQHKPYQANYKFVPLDQISPDLQHAVIAAEDTRFYQHHGFDWQQIQTAAEEDLDGGRLRGASTLTQQLVKNLFFGTSRSVVRKGGEFMLVPMAELLLGKKRILELYLNIVEWGPGVYGAESACRTWERTSARRVSRESSARLAAILPAPLKRRPERMNHYTAIILDRMRQMGW
jgi:monofunctional biosynthetic peptidoglycan transglycosylase